MFVYKGLEVNHLSMKHRNIIKVCTATNTGECLVVKEPGYPLSTAENSLVLVDEHMFWELQSCPSLLFNL